MKNGKYTGKQLNYSNIEYAWFKDDQYHRLDGPAIEYSTGTKFWYINGEIHREYGPAIEYFDGSKSWYYHGEHIDCQSQEEFERIIKLLAFK